MAKKRPRKNNKGRKGKPPKTRARLLRIVALLSIVWGGLLLWSAYRQYAGAPSGYSATQAEVLGLWKKTKMLRRNDAGHDRRMRTMIFIRYRYKIGKDVFRTSRQLRDFRHAQTAQADAAMIELRRQYPKKGQIQVFYQRKNPMRSLFKHRGPLGFSLGMAVFGGLLVVVGFAGFRAASREAKEKI